MHTTAGMIFKYAIKHKMIKDNPCFGATIPTKVLTVEEIENAKIEEKYLERDELFELLDAAKKSNYAFDLERFYLFAFSGLRNGELCALKWTDINFETNEIRVTKTIYNPDNNMKKYELTSPKTKGSIRTFDLPQDIMDMLKRLKVKMNKVRLANRLNNDYHDGNFVFCRENGYPFIQKNVTDRMKSLVKLTSIKKNATPHILRHTHVSMLAEAEVDLPTIMKRVGHEDEETTTKIYTHVTEKMKKKANDKLQNFFGDMLDLTKNAKNVT